MREAPDLGGQPQLPSPLSIANETTSVGDGAPPPASRSLRPGCYLMFFKPAQSNLAGGKTRYVGTLRVDRSGDKTMASGDLYLRQDPLDNLIPMDVIPIFSISAYRYYLRVTQILPGASEEPGVPISFNRHRFHPDRESWTDEGTYTAHLQWAVAPLEYQFSADYLAGEVKDSGGNVAGKMTVGWISDYLRRAVLEIDRVKDAKFPRNGGGKKTNWREVFKAVGFDLKVVYGDTNIPEPPNRKWNTGQLHESMLTHRQSAVSLDREWRYYLLCVHQLKSTPRGLMFDSRGADANQLPREGAAIAAGWVFPDSAMWGKLRNQRFGDSKPAYFRTAVHEIAHAMGLHHNASDTGFMNTTPGIAGQAEPGEFPDNIKFRFAPDDEKRLRHLPDIWLRPGGISWGRHYHTAPVHFGGALPPRDGLIVCVSSLRRTFPIGAPVRIHLTLVNRGTEPVAAPRTINNRNGVAHGSVEGPEGKIRSFRPTVIVDDEHEVLPLDPDRSRNGWLTLFGGPDGPLFAIPGTHRVFVEIEWESEGREYHAQGSGEVNIGATFDEGHEDVANEIRSNPTVQLLISLESADHLTRAIKTIGKALKQPRLREHWLHIEAMRLGRSLLEGGSDDDRAKRLNDFSRLVEKSMAVTGVELVELMELVMELWNDGRIPKKVLNVLHAKSREFLGEKRVKRAAGRLPPASNTSVKAATSASAPNK